MKGRPLGGSDPKDVGLAQVVPDVASMKGRPLWGGDTGSAWCGRRSTPRLDEGLPAQGRRPARSWAHRGHRRRASMKGHPLRSSDSLSSWRLVIVPRLDEGPPAQGAATRSRLGRDELQHALMKGRPLRDGDARSWVRGRVATLPR